MEAQLALFQLDTENEVADIRTEQQQSKKIAYDAGEHIGGSRKDLAKLRKAFEENQSESLLGEIEDFNTALAAELINKNELFKSFSLQNEKENCTEPSVARAKQLLLQRVDTTPSVDSKESRLHFMKATQTLLSLLEPVKSIDDLYSVINDIANLLRHERGNIGIFERRIDEIMHQLDSFEKTSKEWIKLYNQAMVYNDHIKKIVHAKELGLSILGSKFCNFFKSNASYRSTLTNALKVESWEQLLGKKEKKKWTTRKPVWERTLPDRPDRTGGGQSIIEKPEDLIAFFGFRGVEFGHYMDDSKGMEHLLRSSEAMMDLAELLGMDYKSISLHGTLGMAYGARGRGGNALATYEPMAKVINMTKEKGCLGVFSHEWFHALDNRIYDLSHGLKNGRRGYASEPETLGNHIDPLFQILLQELMTEIQRGNSTGYYENTNKPGVKWRGITFKNAYKRHNGDLLKAMTEKIASEKESLESDLRFYTSFSHTTEKKIASCKKRMEKNIKQFALALAWYHEEMTGERIDRIPFPSDKSQYLQSAIALDKQKEGKYWSQPCELAARAFESYIQDKLKASGRRSDYLVAGTRDGAAFPMGIERENINKIFNKIIPFVKEILAY